MLILSGSITILDSTSDAAVRRAAQDLARDFTWILQEPARIAESGAGVVRIEIDTALNDAEAWRIDVTPVGVVIRGADTLGAVFGIYQFSRRCLGVDPLWFWKDLFPAPRPVIELPIGNIESQPPAFRFRGWFLNDEDLLSEWKSGGGRRFIDYPFYGQVIHADVLDAVLEAVLRCGCNLVIPASFVDVMNEAEARLVRQVVERGLYVSQHHVEPLGVSHFGFDNYWRRRGENAAFTFGENPERVLQTWRDFAQRWYDLAGRQIVWQLGLRGRGDRPIWAHDTSVSADQAGAFITRAMELQRQIVGDIDPRPSPPATTTLWAEGAELMASGALTFPRDVTIIFSDSGGAQLFQEDFHTTPREPGRTHGVYFHPAVWSRGPHLVQGVTPHRVREQMGLAVERGDTHYAIINVANVREHVMAIEAATEVMSHGSGFDPDAFLRAWAPTSLHDAYRDLLTAAFDLSEGRLMQDGLAFGLCRDLLAGMCSVPAASASEALKRSPIDPALLLERTAAAAALLDRVIDSFPHASLSPAQRPFATANLYVQAIILRGAFRCLLALAAAYDGPRSLADAHAAIREAVDARGIAEQGRWRHWYRGDVKVNMLGLLNEIDSARRVLTEDRS